MRVFWYAFGVSLMVNFWHCAILVAVIRWAALYYLIAVETSFATKTGKESVFLQSKTKLTTVPVSACLLLAASIELNLIQLNQKSDQSALY